MNTDPKYSEFLNLNEVFCDPDHIKPIFFKKYYPTRIINYTKKYIDEFSNYSYIQGLKYIEQPEFIKNKDQNNKRENYFNKNHQDYLRTLKNFIKHEKGQFVLCGIPSSTLGKNNMVTKIIKELVEEDPYTFIDGSDLMKRMISIEAAHTSSSTRSYERILTSLSREEKKEFYNKKIIVIDDVITSGSSFTAAYKFLTKFPDIEPNQLIFFAFGKTIENILLPQGDNNYSPSQISKYNTFIFDIEQTIVNSLTEIEIIEALDKYNNYNIPETRSKLSRKIKKLVPLFENIQDLFQSILKTKSKIFFITNDNSKFVSSIYLEKFANKLFGTKKPIGQKISYYNKRDLYLNDNPNMQKIGILKCNNNYLDCEFNNLTIGTDCKEKFANIEYSMYKPAPNLVQKIIYDNKLDSCTTIGIGNSLDDIISYRTAGITAALAEWGNRGATTECMRRIANICLKEPLDLKKYIL